MHSALHWFYENHDPMIELANRADEYSLKSPDSQVHGGESDILDTEQAVN